MSKYAPRNEDGLKPWVVTISEWGRKSDRIVYADTGAQAKYQTCGRMRHVTATVRRATPADVKSATR